MSPTAHALFEELAAEQLRRPGTARRRMFGRDGLSVNDKFFAFLDRRGLVLKLPPDTAQALLQGGDASVATSVSPTMRKWVVVPVPPDGGVHSLRELLAQARAHAEGASASAG